MTQLSAVFYIAIVKMDLIDQTVPHRV